MPALPIDSIGFDRFSLFPTLGTDLFAGPNTQGGLIIDGVLEQFWKRDALPAATTGLANHQVTE